MASNSSKNNGKARSAVTGQYVTPDYAAKNPKTTVVERSKSSSGNKGGKGGKKK